MLADLADYPVHAFNWDSRSETNLSLAEGKALLGRRAVIGGLDNGTGLVEAAPQELAWQVRGMRLAMGTKGWMLGTGCTFRPEAPEANVDAIRQAAGSAS